MNPLAQIIYNFFISEQGLQMDKGLASINAKRLAELIKKGTDKEFLLLLNEQLGNWKTIERVIKVIGLDLLFIFLALILIIFILTSN